MMDARAFARRVALIIGVSFPAFSAALADGRAVLPPRWMVDAYLSGATIKPSRDDIARAIIPGMAAAAGARASATQADGPTPSLVGVGTVSASNAWLPTGWAPGDLHILTTAGWGGSSGAGYNTPSGWTLIADVSLPYTPSSYPSQVRIFARVAQSGDSGSQAISATNTPLWAFVTGYRGVYAASPIEAMTIAAAQPSASTLPYRQITTLGKNRRVAQVVAIWSGGSVSLGNPASGWIERAQMGGNYNGAFDDRAFLTAGLTPSANRTSSYAADWCGIAFAVRPDLVVFVPLAGATQLSNSDKSSNTTLSGGDLTFTRNASGAGGVRALVGRSSGKYYWEVKINDVGTQTDVGAISGAAALTGSLGGHGFAWRATTGGLFSNASGIGSAPGSFTTGDILMFAVDYPNKKVFVGKNGNWLQSQNPNSGSGGVTFTSSAAIHPNIECSGVGASATINFGQSPFSYFPPVGYAPGFA